MRETGAAIALNITYVLNMLITDAWIRMHSNSTFKDMLFFYNSTMYKDLKRYFKIAVPGMLMICFEWWAFELLAIFAGMVDEN